MPVLQNDKRTETYSSDQAERLLFGNAETLNRYNTDSEVATSFNHGHDLGAYDELAGKKYSDSAVFSAKQPMFSPYVAENSAASAPSAVADKPVLESYYVPQTEQYAQSNETQRYYNDENPLPAPSFRPRIFDRNLDEIDTKKMTGGYAPAFDIEKIGEFDIAEETETAEKQEIDTDTEPAFVPALKLNARGLIAVCSFFVVAALIVALIIVNSVAIGNANGRISQLQEQNIQAQAELNSASSARDILYDVKTGEVRAFVENPANGYSELGAPRKLPDIKTWSKVDNPDKSTNFFDILSRFFSSIFN